MIIKPYWQQKPFLFLLSSIPLFFLINSCAQNQEEQEKVEEKTVEDTLGNLETNSLDLETLDSSLSEVYSYQIIPNEVSGWGYQIFKGAKLYINQPHIPAVSGNKGFSSEIKAIKTAEFAIYKIENGIIPPTLSKSELDSLEVLN